MNKAWGLKNKSCNSIVNISYLHLELLRLDLAIRKAVQCWQQAGQDANDRFRGLYINERQIKDLLNLPLSGNWVSENHLSAEQEDDFSHSMALVSEQLADLEEQANQAGQTIRLRDIKVHLGLSDFEYDAFLLCLAPVVDSRYEKIFGFLQDDVTQKYASAGLIFDLLLPAGLERLQYLEEFAGGPLIRYRLIRAVSSQDRIVNSPLRQAYLPAGEMIAWLTGNFRPADEFGNSFQLIADEGDAFSGYPYTNPEIDPTVLQETKPVIILYGQDDLHQQETARHISSSLQQPLIAIDLSKINPQNITDGSLVSLVMRDALLNKAIPCFSNCETLQNKTGILQTLFSDLNYIETVIILQCTKVWQIHRNGSRYLKPVMWVKCDLPASSQRLQIWQRYLDAENEIPLPQLEILSGQFTLTSSQIRNAVYSAHDAALQDNRHVTLSDLYAAARRHSSHHLESLAVKIPPRYGWQDIVLPEDELTSLHEIAETVRWRSTVLEEWGVGERLMPNAGVSALFAGPSGTGKTLAAQVIAAELKMDLYKIDLSTVVSKYIGETEKNLERIFTQAHNSNSILFFDEADAIFGKRSEVKDAHDRYANIEVGYLLQRMETYDGVVILATNLRSNLDDAFTRRLQFVVDFPFPDEEERYKIWNVLFPPGVPREPGIDFKSLAERFKLTGGNIRNIIIGAAFLAASQGTPVTTNHILHTLRREMQNMGRLVNEKDLSTLSKEDEHG